VPSASKRLPPGSPGWAIQGTLLTVLIAGAALPSSATQAAGGAASPGSATVPFAMDLAGAGTFPADRMTTWNPGVPGDIPARTTTCATVQASTYGNGGSDATAGIQAAINACPAGRVVQLSAGVFTINSGNFLLVNKGITLRGAGPTQTTLQKTDGARPGVEATGAKPSPIVILGPARWATGNGFAASANLGADAVKGASSVTVASATGFAAGQVVLLDELSGASWQPDPTGRGQIWAAPDFRVVWQKHNPAQPTDDPLTIPANAANQDAFGWFSRLDRPTAEIKQVASVSGKTVTFTTPIHISYRTSHTAQLSRYNYTHTVNAGIESLKVIGGDNGNIRFEWCNACWAKSIDNTQWHDEGFAIDNSFRVEIREFYVHDAAWAQPGGAGYAISLANGSSEVLIENGISVRANKVMVARSAGAASVFGYNYVDEGYINTNGAWVEVGLNASHMVGPHHVLFEGNYGFNFDSDKTHGNAIYHTIFRNHLSGLRAAFTNQLGGLATAGGPAKPAVMGSYVHAVLHRLRDAYRGRATATSASPGGLIDDANQPGNGPRRAAGAGAYSYWHSFIGNVLGVPGKMAGWSYEGTFASGQGSIWLLGWDDWSPYPVDAQVAATTLRHGNFDYLTNTVNWDPRIASHSLPDSLYLPGKPAFFDAGRGYTWPWVDPTGPTKLYELPAKVRYEAGTPFIQP
jgi:hypothetical protein